MMEESQSKSSAVVLIVRQLGLDKCMVASKSIALEVGAGLGVCMRVGGASHREYVGCVSGQQLGELTTAGHSRPACYTLEGYALSPIAWEQLIEGVEAIIQVCIKVANHDKEFKRVERGKQFH